MRSLVALYCRFSISVLVWPTGQHRFLGSGISQVRSLKLDSSIWTNELVEVSKSNGVGNSVVVPEIILGSETTSLKVCLVSELTFTQLLLGLRQSWARAITLCISLNFYGNVDLRDEFEKCSFSFLFLHALHFITCHPVWDNVLVVKLSQSGINPHPHKSLMNYVRFWFIF